MYNYIVSKTGKSVLALSVVCTLFTSVQMASAQSICVNLAHDLSFGLNDSASDNSVSMIQTYLKSSNYLAATPNGYFGLLTLSAVKKYQTNNGISPTGYVGSQTRASINQKTCLSGIVNNNPATSSANQASVSPIVGVPAISNTGIKSPATGQALSIGSSTMIRWDKTIAGGYNISLERPGGAGAGFIALSQLPGSNGNQYLWKVGNIYSSITNSYQDLPIGTYRIRIQGNNTGSTPNDDVSGWFTVIAPQFSVTSIAPASAYADDATSVVLLGSGFSRSTNIYFDSNYSNLQATSRYVSPDGTVIVFTVPTSVTSGSHTLFINNAQSSLPVTLSFVVSSAQ